MRNWRAPLVALGFALALGASLAAYVLTGSAQGNAGDVWVDNVGQPAGPGHEQDPHLMCDDINLWGNGLADAAGTFTINSWPPTGNGAVAYGPAPWTYNRTMGGDQVLAVIPIRSLLAGSVANGDVVQPQQGLHFKLQFVQDPQKHKTFWVECLPASPSPSPSPSPTATATPTPTPTPTPSHSPSPTPSHSPSPTPTGSVAPTATPSASASPSPSPSSTPAVPALAGTGGGPGSGPGSAGGSATQAIALILIMVGGMLLARGALRR
jgi:hypothetical protein